MSTAGQIECLPLFPLQRTLVTEYRTRARCNLIHPESLHNISGSGVSLFLGGEVHLLADSSQLTHRPGDIDTGLHARLHSLRAIRTTVGREPRWADF